MWTAVHGQRIAKYWQEDVKSSKFEGLKRSFEKGTQSLLNILDLGNEYYKLIAILRREYDITLTASWEKIYSELGFVASRLHPIRNIFSPN